MSASERFGIQGRVSRGFEAVRQTFIENFSRRRELGGACCVFHRGEKVVDFRLKPLPFANAVPPPLSPQEA